MPEKTANDLNNDIHQLLQNIDSLISQICEEWAFYSSLGTCTISSTKTVVIESDATKFVRSTLMKAACMGSQETKSNG